MTAAYITPFKDHFTWLRMWIQFCQKYIMRSARSPCQNQGLQQKLHCWPFSHGMVSFKDYMQLLCLSLGLASTWRCFQLDLLYSSILSMVGGGLKPGSNVTAEYILHGFRFNQLWGVFPLKHLNLRVDSVIHANILQLSLNCIMPRARIVYE